MGDRQPTTSKGGNAPIQRQGQTTSGAFGQEYLAKSKGAASRQPTNVDL